MKTGDWGIFPAGAVGSAAVRERAQAVAAVAMSTSSQGTSRVKEVHCKTILSKSGLADWALNCYAGCEHGCLYCYARFATRFSHPREAWGSFVDVKVNAPQALAREAMRKRVGVVFVSSVCDGWQPIEEKYGLTRQCLEILLRHGFPLHILTKSALAQRDFDLLAGKQGVEFGVTLTTMDDNLSRLVKPRSSTPTERLRLLEEAKKSGVRTHAFLGPLMPYLSDTEENIERLLKIVKEIDVDFFYLDQLNPRYGVWPSVKTLLQDHFPHLIPEYKRILYHSHFRMAYSRRLATMVHRLARRNGIEQKMELLF